MRVLVPIAFLLTSCSSMSMAQAPTATEPAIGAYAHDERPRQISKTRSKCPKVDLVKTSGTHLPYNRELEVDRHFLPKLQAFEKVVLAEADAVFGRPPTELIHRGGYRCRPVTGSRSKWSEHAFGNAIDIAGFQFGEGEDAFIVDVGDDWRAGGKNAEFLHRIAYRAVHERLFRIILGPGDPGHEELLHLDWGTSWYVRIELPDDLEVAATPSGDDDSAPANQPRIRVLKR